MKIALFILGLFCLAALTNAGTLHDAKMRHMSRTLTPEKFASNLKSTDFGKSLFNLLSLQFKTSGKLDDVNTLLVDLKNKITQQQADDTAQYNQATANNNQIITDQESIIANAEQIIEASETQLNNDQAELLELANKQAALEQQEQNLLAQIQSYTAIRAEDAALFAARIASQNQLLDGLASTIAVLQKKLEQGVQNEDGINQIIGLLQQLQSAFSASIEEDTEQEAQAIQNLEDFVSASQALIAQIDSDLSDIADRVAALNIEIASLKSTIEAQQEAETNAQALKDQTIVIQQSLDSKYNNNKSVRSNQVSQLDQAINVLNNNAQDVQNYLNQA